MSHASFQVVFDGPALVGSTIDVRDLSPALLALGDVIEQANATLNTGSVSVALKVHASFKSGCFGIDFSVVQSLLDQALGLFRETRIADAKELMELLGFVVVTPVSAVAGLLQFIKWLRGRRISEVVLVDNGRVRVIVEGGDAIETERATIELFRNYRLRLALQKAIAEPLERDGFETVAIGADPAAGFVVVEKHERAWFVAPAPDEETLDESIERVTLQIVSVTFRDDNKWRFSDGTNNFYATVSDNDFLNRVRLAEESFTSGDILSVNLRRRQWLSGDVMKSEYEVVEVLEHRKAMAQLRIPFRES